MDFEVTGATRTRRILNVQVSQSPKAGDDTLYLLGKTRSHDVMQGIEDGLNNLLGSARALGLMVYDGAALAPDATPAAPVAAKAKLGDLARRAFRERRRREKLFGDNALFGEPGWDLLLDLFIAAEQGKSVSITQACIGACVPSTTALRWISLMESKDLLVRENDPQDARRALIRLSAGAYAKMVDYLSDLPV